MRCWEGPHAHGVHLEADGQGAAWSGGLPAALCSQCLLDSLPAGGHSSPTTLPVLPAPFLPSLPFILSLERASYTGGGRDEPRVPRPGALSGGVCQ